ncbi:MAG: hypothetical protein EU536_00155 [Promethearchaeota archaeon]|nr:MAG: hypothetical protein EU536_00155 [Candidatus Lokiarchaeota archaeon]
MVDLIPLMGYFFVIATFLFIIAVTIAQARRSHNLKHAESYYSLVLSIISLILSFIVLCLFISLDFLMGLIISLCFGTLFGLFLVFNLLHFLITRNRPVQVSQHDVDYSGRENFKHELFRKIFHIILFFGIIALLVIAFEVLHFLNGDGEFQLILDTYWGNLDGSDMHLLHSQDFGQGIIFMLFSLLTTLFTMNEGARLGKWFFFPLEKLASFGVREKEKDTVASYVYFVVGIMFAATFLYPIPVFSVIGILCFADTAASLFGRKFGTHKLQFNKSKSWEGSIAGFAVSLLVTILIVGPIWGLVASVVFLVTDAITPTLPLSDNIAIPVFVSAAYLFLSFLQIPMESIIFSLLG